MKAAWKRFIAVLLVVSLVLGVCPDTVRAEGVSEVETVMEQEAPEEPTEESVQEALEAEEKTEEAPPVEEPAGETSEETVKGETEETGKAVPAEMEETKEDAMEEAETGETGKEEEAEPEEISFEPVERVSRYCLRTIPVYARADRDGEILTELKRGACFTITASAPDWYQIEYTEDTVKTGYIEKRQGDYSEEEPDAEEEEEMISLFAAQNSYMVYSDGSWSGGTIWYVMDGKKRHYVFCLDKGATMYSGKYSGTLVSGYSGKDAFRISTALNYFKGINDGWNGKAEYGTVQNTIWGASNGLTTYINHAWQLASNNSSRKAGSSSYDTRLKVIGGTSAAEVKKAGTALKLKSENGAVQDTLKLSGSAWKYFAKEAFPFEFLHAGDRNKSSTITVAGIYDKDGKKQSVRNGSWVGTDGVLHVDFQTDAKTGFGGKDNPAVLVMQVNFPYKGGNSINYVKTGDKIQNVTFDASGTSTAYFAVKVYAEDSGEITPEFHINKVDEFGEFVPGCTFRVTGSAGEALATGYDSGNVVINSPADYFKIEQAGTYTVRETAVPDNGEYEINDTVWTFYAIWRTEITGGASGLETKNILVLSTRSILNPLEHGDIDLTYDCINYYNAGNAELTKYLEEMVAFKDGNFVYEKRPLAGTTFALYAAEDIYCGETLVFEAGKRIEAGAEWGRHEVEISEYTDEDGKYKINELPVGSYYLVETASAEGVEVPDTQYPFTIEADKTVTIKEGEGIINKQEPAVCHVFKVDADTMEPLSGGEFTIYAGVNNTNFKGEPLFTAADTVPAVTARNLATGEETKETGKWVPITAVTTDSGGTAEFSDLPRGKYLVTETKAPVNAEGRSYELAEESYQFQHDGKTNGGTNGYNFEHTFQDVLAKDYRILKHAETAQKADDGSRDVYFYNNAPAAGAVFGIYTEEDIYDNQGILVRKAGEQVTSVTTNEQGIAAFTGVLYSGKYCFKELKTPDDERYILDEETYHFTVDAGHPGGQLNEEPLVNQLYKGSIKVIKTDGTTKYPLKGVEFRLFDQDEQMLGTFVTDEKGEILIENLPVGMYYLQETATLDGYKLDDRLIKTEITKDSLNQTVEVENKRYDTSITIRTNTTINGHGGVKTGDRGLSAFLTGFFFFMFLALAAVWIYRKYAGKSLKRIWKRENRRKAAFVSGLALSLVLSGSLAVCLSVSAALKKGTERELTDVEYGGTVYAYALQKEFELPDEDTDLASYFDQTVNGMELKEISYETINTVKKKELQTLEESRDYKELTEKDESKVDGSLTVDGEVYTLADIQWTEEPNIEHVDYAVEYGYRTEAPEPEDTYAYTYTSPVTKQENTVTLPFVRLETGDTRWVDGFSAIVTLHNLDGKYFTLGKHEFAYNPDSISFSSSDYTELVRMLGYDTSKYRLNSGKWQGKAYKDKDGVTCRDAYVEGQQYAASYQARYEGDVENGSLYTAHATYTLEQETVTDEVEAYVVQATAYYNQEQQKRISIGAAIGIFILAVLVVGGLYAVAGSRKKKKLSDGRNAD